MMLWFTLADVANAQAKFASCRAEKRDKLDAISPCNVAVNGSSMVKVAMDQQILAKSFALSCSARLCKTGKTASRNNGLGRCLHRARAQHTFAKPWHSNSGARGAITESAIARQLGAALGSNNAAHAHIRPATSRDLHVPTCRSASRESRACKLATSVTSSRCSPMQGGIVASAHNPRAKYAPLRWWPSELEAMRSNLRKSADNTEMCRCLMTEVPP
mmetsp:Transcript_98006/g.281947  ORF Transcript_98006/g.281947 Transcript_98006/m.281947 type:complete len:217 (+) Transcript_98006:1025-1675(+)